MLFDLFKHLRQLSGAVEEQNKNGYIYKCWFHNGCMFRVVVPGSVPDGGKWHESSACFPAGHPCSFCTDPSDRHPDCRSTEALAFKFDFSEREHGVFAVHDAVSVVDQDIRQVGVFGINGRKYAPYCAEQMIFRTEPEELDERAQGIIMRFMQNGVAGRDTFAQFLYPFFGRLG